MNERRKLINWMAGVTTFIVVLLIVIVLLDREEDGVSLAAASRTVALTLESGNGILENAPETSNFDEDLSDQWYVKYMDYLSGQGYLDSGSVKADERSATSAVTYAVLSDWAKKASEEGKGETDALLSYVDSGDRAKKAVSSENFWKFYDAFRAAVDPDRAVAEVETDLYGTPDNVDGAPNDYASMEEVLTRRFTHGMEELEEERKNQEDGAEAPDGSFGSFTRFPDLILMDGGRGQVNIALSVLSELKLNIPVCGMVKDDNHRTRGLYYNNVEIPIDRHSEGFKLVTRIQDEAHRFAIEYHRSLRSKAQVHSVLDDIEGIGPARRKALMRRFKSLEAVRDATLEELESTEGMNKRAAESVYAYFREKDRAPEITE